MKLRMVAAAFIILLALYGLWQQNSYSNRVPSAEAARLDTVQKGVHFAGRNLSHWRSQQVRQFLEELALEFGSEPKDAKIDSVNKALIPELNGIRLDHEKTLTKILQAPADSNVTPVLEQIPAAEKLQDLEPLPIRQGNPGKRAVTFLINVAWGNEHLPSILKSLTDYNVQASFFLVGKWAEKNPADAKKIAQAGHEINSHGYSTVGIASLSSAQQQQQLEKANQVIKQAAGRTPRYFSPHRGEYNQSLLRLTRQYGQHTILWSIDTVDWKSPGRDWIVRRVLRLLHPGGLILMHPTKDTAQALPHIISSVQKQGYRIIPLDDMLSPNPLR